MQFGLVKRVVGTDQRQRGAAGGPARRGRGPGDIDQQRIAFIFGNLIIQPPGLAQIAPPVAEDDIFMAGSGVNLKARAGGGQDADLVPLAYLHEYPLHRALFRRGILHINHAVALAEFLEAAGLDAGDIGPLPGLLF